MYNSRKSQISVLIVLAILAVLSISKDGGSISDFIGIIIWCTWAPLIFVILLTRTYKEKNIYRHIAFGAFVATSIFAFVTLTLITLQTILHGPLNESGMIFIVFPIGFIKLSVVGSAIGAIVHWLNIRRRNA